jgi:hypothetical protein
LSPLTVLTKLAWSAQKSERESLHSDGQQQSCRLWSRKPQVLGPKGSLLTNRVRENFTHGSVGGGGSNPASYPAWGRPAFDIGCGANGDVWYAATDGTIHRIQ